jgi:hypothetical protein
MRYVPTERLEVAEAAAQGRMKKKVLAAREALAAGVPSVILGDSRRASPLLAALDGEGTVIGQPLGSSFALPLRRSGVTSPWNPAAFEPALPPIGDLRQGRELHGPELVD